MPKPSYDQYLSVSEVSHMVSENFNQTKPFQKILVKGEVTNYKGPSGGHHYFSIKDENALLPCVIWGYVANSIPEFKLESGKQVALIGKFKYYEPKGTVSLHVSRITDLGEGEANLRYMQLCERLKEEGLFDEAHKQPIPKFPKTVGIVTSQNGEARNDIEKVAKKRNPYIQLLLYHVNVQGKDACRTIVEGIRALDAMQLDTIIVGRGGGSQEELLAYNEEAVARAVYEAKTPIISAVGHQGNWALIDYVSDKRVATPSEAAEEAIPNVMDTVRRVRFLDQSIRTQMRGMLRLRMQKLETVKVRLNAGDPVRKLADRKRRLGDLSDRLDHRMKAALDKRKVRFGIQVTKLNGLSPTAKLVGGFGYISSEGAPIRSIADVAPGDAVEIRLHDGAIFTTVTETRTETQSA